MTGETVVQQERQLCDRRDSCVTGEIDDRRDSCKGRESCTARVTFR